MEIKTLLQKIKNELAVGINIKNIISLEEEDLLCEYLVELNIEYSFTKISVDTGLSREYMRRILKKRGYKAVNKQNILRCRKNLFSSVETEEDAYWLGFIFADGYISDQGALEISLKYTDYNHLLKFADYAGFDKTKVVKKQKTTNGYYRTRIGFKVSKDIKENLSKLGIVPRKSLTAIYPTLRSDLHKHFIRGYVDGDGCISIRKPRTKNNIVREVTLSILGTKDFLLGINTSLNVPLKNIRKRKNIHILTFSCREARNILYTLYENSTISLDRKYNIYKSYIAPLYSDI